MTASDRANPLVYVSVGIAVLSFATSLYQSYLFTQQVEIMQRNVARGEYMRTCKDVIDSYFQVRLKSAALNRLASRPGASGDAVQSAETEAANAVGRFAALGTYLANFQNDDVRYRYTQLSRMLDEIVKAAAQPQSADLARLFDPADTLFAAMNDDCVRSAKGMAFAAGASPSVARAADPTAIIASR